MRSDKEHWSNWHITINFNAQGGAGLIATARDCIDDLFEHKWQWIMKYENGTRKPFAYLEQDLINTVKATVGFERGSENGYIHAHILLEIGHWSLVQIDKDEIKRILDLRSGCSTNIHFRFLPGNASSKDYILRYITKTIRDAPNPADHQGANKKIVEAFTDPDADDYENEYL